MIPQKELARAHKHHPHWIREDRLDDNERQIYMALKAGDKIEKGTLQAHIETREYRRRIHWREELEKMPGGTARAKQLDNDKNVVKKYEYLVLE